VVGSSSVSRVVGDKRVAFDSTWWTVLVTDELEATEGSKQRQDGEQTTGDRVKGDDGGEMEVEPTRAQPVDLDDADSSPNATNENAALASGQSCDAHTHHNFH
jgi:hypothetical protein